MANISNKNTGFKKGHIGYKYWLGKKLPYNARKKMSSAKLGKKRFGNPSKWKHSEETKKKISDALTGRDFDRNEKHIKYKHGKTNTGYKRININGKRYLEHRYIMEKKMGRRLLRTEFVHHKNGVNDDNREENLVLVVTGNHFTDINCPHCGFNFYIK